MRRIYLIFLLLLLNIHSLYSQCSVNIDTANIIHISCPNGGPVGAAQIVQANYLNYSWTNITNGQLYNGGGGNGGTFRNDLDAGLYVVTASQPYSISCPNIVYSDTFRIKMPIVNIQPSPTQACPNECNVLISMNLSNPINPNVYTYSFDGLSPISTNSSFQNICGGIHTYEVFANGQSCGIESFGVSQFAPMILSTSVNNVSCSQNGNATVNITGVGASAISNYCLSLPQYSNYSTIENVVLIGDNTSINNNTSNICNTYSDFTSISADVTPGNNYTLNLDLGTCHPGGFALLDIANVFIDWNIDGDFDDNNEMIGSIPTNQSPSFHSINFSVPINAIPGQSRMRIVMQNSQWQPSNQANSCDYNTSWFGETEDYRILVNGSVATPVSYLWSNGQSNQTSTNLSAGIYYVTITDANNCTASDTAIVLGPPVVSVNASGDQTICNGDIPLPLSATSVNSGTYSWSPASDFINANVPNPIFANGLTSTTTYIVTFTASGCVTSDTVTIFVNPIPTVTLSAFPNPSCIGDTIILTATSSIPVNLYRFQFNTGLSWFNVTSPLQWISTNPIIFPNVNSTMQFRVKVREDVGCNTSAWSPSLIVPASIVTTQPISHN